MRGLDSENYRIVFKIKEGCSEQDTIITMGIAKGQRLRGRIKRLQRIGEEIPDLTWLCTLSRKSISGGILN